MLRCYSRELYVLCSSTFAIILTMQSHNVTYTHSRFNLIEDARACVMKGY